MKKKRFVYRGHPEQIEKRAREADRLDVWRAQHGIPNPRKIDTKIDTWQPKPRGRFPVPKFWDPYD